jgi:hypothetical protein
MPGSSKPGSGAPDRYMLGPLTHKPQNAGLLLNTQPPPNRLALVVDAAPYCKHAHL